jgi:hypothetical protein
MFCSADHIMMTITFGLQVNIRTLTKRQLVEGLWLRINPLKLDGNYMHSLG